MDQWKRTHLDHILSNIVIYITGNSTTAVTVGDPNTMDRGPVAFLNPDPDPYY